VRTEP